jgi:hypothetical protein
MTDFISESKGFNDPSLRFKDRKAAAAALMEVFPYNGMCEAYVTNSNDPKKEYSKKSKLYSAHKKIA